MACPACGAAAWDPLYEKRGHAYVECRDCGLARLDPVPDPAEARSLYDRGYFTGEVEGGYPDYVGDAAVHRRNAAARMRRIERAWGGPPGRLLDVGCAVGFVLEAARDRGWETVGVEASDFAADWARRRLGLDVRGDLESVGRREGGFDVVTFFQVVEHLADPAATVREAVRLLRPGGIVMVESWDRDAWVARASGRHWQQITPPTVIYLLSRETTAGLLERCGLDVTGASRSAKWVSVGHVTRLLGDKHPGLFGAVADWIEDTAVARLSVPYALGDLFTMTARRPARP